jgi:hypothetical protein
LILSKDSMRITIFSLSTGQETARLRGAFSSASGETNLLAASDAERLIMYDLKSGAKRGDFLLPEDVAYTHFSADGKRLLVLTMNQAVYLLDVSGAAAPAAVPAKP